MGLVRTGMIVKGCSFILLLVCRERTEPGLAEDKRKGRSRKKQVALIWFFLGSEKKNGRREGSFCFLDSVESASEPARKERAKGKIKEQTESGGGYLVFLIGGRISRNSIDRQRCGCQDKKRMKKQHGVNIMEVKVQIGWFWTWTGKRSWVREESKWK
ncbi:hypothetical protein Tco_0105425 [Tanacetum coccineum]